MKNEVIFYNSKKKIRLIIFALALMCLLGLFIIFGIPDWELVLFYFIPLNKLFFGSLIIAVSLFFIILFHKRLSNNEPALIINSKSIYDQSSHTSVGEIKVEDVYEIKVLKVGYQKQILLKVKNPDEYINRQKSVFKKRILQMNYKGNGTPIVLSAVGINCSFKELYLALQNVCVLQP